MINQMTIIGLGWVGKSIAKAIRNASFTRSIMGYDPNPEIAESTSKEALIDQYRIEVASAVKNADLIVITLPFSEYEGIFHLLANNIRRSTVITDIASIKLPTLQLAKETLGKCYSQFVPSHPIINIPNNQSHLAMLDIFAERPVIITPTEETCPRCLQLVGQFWQKMGGEIEFKLAAENDAIVASVSHLPQILAFTFINSLKDGSNTLRYITRNFIDFTSIATQSPVAWSDVCIANRQAILKELANFESGLRTLKKILQSENAEILLEHFNNAKQLRQNLEEKN